MRSSEPLFHFGKRADERKEERDDRGRTEGLVVDVVVVRAVEVEVVCAGRGEASRSRVRSLSLSLSLSQRTGWDWGVTLVVEVGHRSLEGSLGGCRSAVARLSVRLCPSRAGRRRVAQRPPSVLPHAASCTCRPTDRLPWSVTPSPLSCPAYPGGLHAPSFLRQGVPGLWPLLAPASGGTVDLAEMAWSTYRPGKTPGSLLTVGVDARSVPLAAAACCVLVLLLLKLADPPPPPFSHSIWLVRRLPLPPILRALVDTLANVRPLAARTHTTHTQVQAATVSVPNGLSFSSHAQQQALLILLHKLTHLLPLPLRLLFVFDGTGRPGWKRGRRVAKSQVGEEKRWREMIEAVGFQCWTVCPSPLPPLGRPGGLTTLTKPPPLPPSLSPRRLLAKRKPSSAISPRSASSILSSLRTSTACSSRRVDSSSERRFAPPPPPRTSPMPFLTRWPALADDTLLPFPPPAGRAHA